MITHGVGSISILIDLMGRKQYYNYIENNELTFNTYVQECKQRALYDTGIDAEYGDKLVTLSTCEYSNDNGRLIVVAKKIGGIKK